jgi:hypothetical protein
MSGVLGDQFTLLTFLLFVTGAVRSIVTAVRRVGIFMCKNMEMQKSICYQILVESVSY